VKRRIRHAPVLNVCGPEKISVEPGRCRRIRYIEVEVVEMSGIRFSDIAWHGKVSSSDAHGLCYRVTVTVMRATVKTPRSTQGIRIPSKTPGAPTYLAALHRGH